MAAFSPHTVADYERIATHLSRASHSLNEDDMREFRTLIRDMGYTPDIIVKELRTNIEFLPIFKMRLHQHMTEKNLKSIQSREDYKHYLNKGDQSSLASQITFDGSDSIQDIEAMFKLPRTDIKSSLFHNYARKYGSNNMEELFDMSICFELGCAAGNVKYINTLLNTYPIYFFQILDSYERAAEEGHVDILILLQPYLWNDIATSVSMSQALLKAAKNGQKKVIDYLLTKITDERSLTESKIRIAEGSITGGYPELLELYSIDIADIPSYSLLIWSLIGDNDELTKIAFNRYPNIQEAYSIIGGGLFDIVEAGKTELVKAIIKQATPRFLALHGYLVGIAMTKGYYEIAELLGKYINAQDRKEWEMVRGAAVGGHLIAFTKGESYGINGFMQPIETSFPDIRQTTLNESLTVALARGHMETAEYLIAKGANIKDVPIRPIMSSGSKDVLNFLREGKYFTDKELINSLAQNDFVDLLQSFEIISEELWNELVIENFDGGFTHNFIEYAFVEGGATNLDEIIQKFETRSEIDSRIHNVLVRIRQGDNDSEEESEEM